LEKIFKRELKIDKFVQIRDSDDKKSTLMNDIEKQLETMLVQIFDCDDPKKELHIVTFIIFLGHGANLHSKENVGLVPQ
jgi:hypothetical protein